MGVEIERKFLVNKDKWAKLSKEGKRFYRQGYISVDPVKTVRVRLSDSEGYITIKGQSVGASRLEYEYAIPQQEASELLNHFCTSIITKYRYEMYVDGKRWEVDEFLEENEGLMVAEIELTSEDEKFSVPDWIEKEVTGEKQYYNSSLSMHPYKSWKK